MPKPFKIYRSSAGSGKTYTLAKDYLRLALRNPAYFRHILAVTFTNKATQEMKDRILRYLHDFSRGRQNEMYHELKDYLQFNETQFQDRCQSVLSNILHSYTNFAVSTIDAFFQKVIRAFSREVGLYGGFTLELEQDKVLAVVIDRLLEEIGENQTLTEWLIRFSEGKVDEGKSWDVRNDIRTLGYEVFKEHFKVIEPGLIQASGTPQQLLPVVKEVRQIIAVFENYMKGLGEKGLSLMQQYQLEVGDFAYSKTGVANYFNRLVEGNDYEPKNRVLLALDNVEAWYSKTSQKKDIIQQAVEAGLIAWLNDAVDYYNKQFFFYESAREVLRNLYTYGILSDITRKLREYKQENDVMLISDAAHFLKEIIDDNDSPFIYEKVGSFYHHFLIDEFQDTSGFQWQNFKPLVENSLAEGYSNMVVGDVKQSIYRWRGGDWKLLLDGIQNEMPDGYIQAAELAHNFRSKYHVVTFNNQLFATAAGMLKNKLSEIISAVDDEPLQAKLLPEAAKIEAAYQQVKQQPTQTGAEVKKGCIHMTFLADSFEEDGTKTGWKEKVNRRIPEILEDLQDQGVSLKDIALLVRNARDGKAIADFLLDFRQSDQAKQEYLYDVVSNEALFLQAAPSIQLLINIFKYLVNPQDQVARVSVAYEYQRYVINNEEVANDDLVFAKDEETLEAYLPEAFRKQRNLLNKIPLFELVERLIEIFELHKLSGELAYIQAFQDYVLNFTGKEKDDISSFLSWWEDNAHKLAIQVSDDIDAVQILTIHKSKGLQFKVVIIPYLNWELDHDTRKSNILWSKSAAEPFSKFGYFPLRYSNNLKNTVFKADYYQEMVLSYMDNLNLLYVAFTRAEDGLFAFGNQPSKTRQTQQKINDVAALVHHILTDAEMVMTIDDDDQTTFKLGSIADISSSGKETEQTHTITLNEYHTSSWRHKLAIRQRAGELFTEVVEERQSKINYGLLIHELLSRIKHKDNLEKALQDLLLEGVIGQNEQNLLHQKITKLWQVPSVDAWFSTDWEVKTEVPILPKTGEMSRPDRVMIRGQQAIIVDFKTGERKSRDRQQVIEYADLLKAMGFAEIEGYLLYIEEEATEQVV